MSDFELRRESIEEDLDYNVKISRFENDYEQRRLINEPALIGFNIKTPAMTYTQMKQYRDFLVARYGALTSFTFTSPFDNTEYTVRFDPGSFRLQFAKGVYEGRFSFRVLR